MTPSPQSGPPMSPEVMAQGLPPMQRYAPEGAAMLNASAGAGSPGADPANFAKSELDKVAAALTNVAKVIGETKPELMPLVQKMAEAGSMLSNELQAQNPAGGQVQGGPPPGGPPDTGTAPPQAQAPKDVGLGQ